MRELKTSRQSSQATRMLVPTELATKKWSGELFAKNSPDHFLSPAQAHGLGDEPDQRRAGPAALDVAVQEVWRTSLLFSEGRQRVEVLAPQVLDEPMSGVEARGRAGESIAFDLQAGPLHGGPALAVLNDGRPNPRQGRHVRVVDPAPAERVPGL